MPSLPQPLSAPSRGNQFQGPEIVSVNYKHIPVYSPDTHMPKWK